MDAERDIEDALLLIRARNGDADAFADPSWSDRMARALYRSLVEVFAPEDE